MHIALTHRRTSDIAVVRRTSKGMAWLPRRLAVISVWTVLPAEMLVAHVLRQRCRRRVQHDRVEGKPGHFLEPRHGLHGFEDTLSPRECTMTRNEGCRRLPRIEPAEPPLDRNSGVRF